MTDGTIITFYSYKGGVGRTFALANIATLLAKWGHRVLCVDWDLEAPGLHLYFEKHLLEREPGGLVDVLTAFRPGDPALAWRDQVTRIRLPEAIPGELELLCAGTERGYVERVQTLDWTVLYNDGLGPAIERMRDEWRARYDFVLVDSRTGFNDIGSICTVQIPDVVVMLASPNRQSLEGLQRVALAAEAARERLPVDRARLLFVPVVTRFESRTERDLAAEWLKKFAEMFEPLCRGWLHRQVTILDLLAHTQVPHVAYWSFGENLPVLDEGIDNPEGIGHAFATLAALLGNRLVNAVDLVANRDTYLHQAWHPRSAEQRYRHDVFIAHTSSAKATARALARHLELAGLRAFLDESIPTGTRWADALDTAIETSQHFVVLFDAAPTTWQRRETEAILRAVGQRSGTRLLILLLPGGSVPPELVNYQRIQTGADVVAAFGKVEAELVKVEPRGETYREWLRTQHAQVIPFFPGAGDRLLAEIYVDLEVMPEARAEHLPDPARPDSMRPDLTRLERSIKTSTTLSSLLRRDDIGPHRWVILGEPGAGKTTLLRHLTRCLADQPTGPVPIFLSLVRHAATQPDPIQAAVAEARSAGADARETLNAVAQSGDLWILLDGLDEVAPELQEPTRAWIEALHHRYPQARIVVASRPIAVSQVGLRNHFEYLRVRPLSEPQQVELLTRLLGAAEAATMATELRARPTLGDMAKSPLLLTMIAMVGREAGALGGALPAHRKQLYEQVIDLLLRRGHCPEPKGVKDRRTAREVLKHLSLRLHQSGGETWTPEALDVELWAVREDTVLNRRLKETWGSNDTFLDDIGHNSGVLGPHDGPQEPWRYLHRSQREFLAAEALAEDAEALKRVLGLLQVKDRQERFKNASRWGEVLLLACNLVPDPLVALTAIRDADSDLALRAVADVPTLAPEKALDFLFNTPGWDGEHLLALAQLWREPPAAVAERLWALVQPSADSYRLGCLWYVLAHFGAPFDRFGKQANLPRPINLPFVRIPGGTFRMGSTEYEPEGPIHEVTLAPFELMATPVTNAEFKSLFARHQPHVFGKKADAEGRHPVNTVSWYEAHLFATWAGGHLPTEAQWEYACRAGTTTRWFHGDEEAGLAEYAWFGEGLQGKTHPVGRKKPNAFGLFDMHGQVWEWCHDWYGAYPGVPQTEPPGAPRGDHRVIRGGSYWGDAVRCRSAFRDWDHPGSRNWYLGFRLVRPAPPSSVDH